MVVISTRNPTGCGPWSSFNILYKHGTVPLRNKTEVYQVKSACSWKRCWHSNHVTRALWLTYSSLKQCVIQYDINMIPYCRRSAYSELLIGNFSGHHCINTLVTLAVILQDSCYISHSHWYISSTDGTHTLHRGDHSGYGLCQWEKTLQSNVFSHWLSPYPEWSQHGTQEILSCNPTM